MTKDPFEIPIDVHLTERQVAQAFIAFLMRLEREVPEPLSKIAAETLHSLGIVD